MWRWRRSPCRHPSANLDADGGDFGADVEQFFDDEVNHSRCDGFGERAGQEIDSDGDDREIATYLDQAIPDP